MYSGWLIVEITQPPLIWVTDKPKAGKCSTYKTQLANYKKKKKSHFTYTEMLVSSLDVWKFQSYFGLYNLFISILFFITAEAIIAQNILFFPEVGLKVSSLH